MECKHCKSTIEEGIKRCPHCGGKLGMSTLEGIFALVLIGLAGIFIIGS